MMKSIIVSCLVMVILTGCQSLQKSTDTFRSLLAKRDDGSLDYQSAKKLAPIQLPKGQATLDFVPLYAIPDARKNTLNLSNEAGKQYQLPTPPQVVVR